MYVVGLSFGTLLALELLANVEPPADGYLLMVGRLDLPTEAAEIYAEGDAPGFVDGTELVLRGTGVTTRERNQARLVAALARHRYSERLADADLCRMVFVAGEEDERVGRLGDAERELLERRGAEAVIGPGRHDETVEDHLASGLARLLGPDLVIERPEG